MKSNKFFVTLFVLAIAVGAVHGSRFFFGPKGKVTFDKRILNRSKGSPNAPTWIVEYMDYQCPPCRKMFHILESYFEEYPSQIYLQVRFHPLKMHAHGLESAVYSECATRQKKFWEFHSLLFENQKEWVDLGKIDDKFHEYAARVGLDLQALDKCVADPATQEAVLKENIEGSKLGVASTPTFFMNGKMIAGSKEMTEELKKLFPKSVIKYKLEEDHAK